MMAGTKLAVFGQPNYFSADFRRQ